MSRLEQIKDLEIDAKNKLAAIYISKQRIEGSKTLDIMTELDDIYTEQYYHFKIYHGFNVAQILALEHILNLIYKQ